MENKIKREFKLTTLALKNRNSIFLLTLVIILFGILSYRNLPKELFPDIVLPTVLVQEGGYPTEHLGNNLAAFLGGYTAA